MPSPIDRAIEALPEEHRAFLLEIRRFVTAECIPADVAIEQSGHPPPALLARMKQLGLFGLTIPEEHGGLGLGLTLFSLVLYELARAHPVIRTYININNGIGSHGLIHYGTRAQKARYLPALASGELIASFCLTEPGAGSDAAHITARAVRTDSGWRLDGVKHFITNAPFAGLFTVIAVSDPPRGARGGMTAFLVARETPGLSVGPVQKTMGGVAQHQSEVVLEACEVNDDAVLGEVGEGFAVAMRTLDAGRISLSASAIGIAQRALEAGRAWALQRRAFGQPIGEFQGIQWMLADSATELYAASTMLLDACRRHEAGEDVSTEASMLKLFASEKACEIADRVIQIHGGHGYTLEGGVERLYRFLRMFRIVEGTSEIQRMKIARALLKT
jgi:acyl-CoA dehydrogenase